MPTEYESFSPAINSKFPSQISFYWPLLISHYVNKSPLSANWCFSGQRVVMETPYPLTFCPPCEGNTMLMLSNREYARREWQSGNRWHSKNIKWTIIVISMKIKMMKISVDKYPGISVSASISTLVFFFHSYLCVWYFTHSCRPRYVFYLFFHRSMAELTWMKGLLVEKVRRKSEKHLLRLIEWSFFYVSVQIFHTQIMRARFLNTGSQLSYRVNAKIKLDAWKKRYKYNTTT